MDQEITKAIKQVIKNDIGDMVADEIKARFEPITGIFPFLM